MSLRKITEKFRTKRFLDVFSWACRVVAVILSVYLISVLAPSASLAVAGISPTLAVVLIASAAVLYLMLIRPAVSAYRSRRERMNAEVAAIVGFSSLSTRESALHIPKNVPSGLRDAVIWEAEMTEKTSPSGVKEAARIVLDRYRGGIPASDVSEVLAIHEAGHATVALALGRAVVGIRRNDHSGATYSLNQFSAPTSHDIWNDMILTVAGTQAEQMWSKWENKYPTNGHDDRSDAMGFVTILTFAGWTPDPSVNSDIDSLLHHAQSEARRLLIENKAMHDDLASLVRKKDVVTASEILDVAKRHR